MIRWSTPAAARQLMNECLSTCGPRSTSHLLPASVRLKWSWASSLVEGAAHADEPDRIDHEPLFRRGRMYHPQDRERHQDHADKVAEPGGHDVAPLARGDHAQTGAFSNEDRIVHDGHR